MTRRALNASVQLYFDWLNLDGGTGGETVHLVARNDEQKTERIVHNVHDVTKIDNPVTTSAVVGTANVEAPMCSSMLTRANLPLTNPTTGASSMTGDPLVSPIKASYRQETDKMVSTLVTIGVTHVGVLYQDGALGKEVLTDVERTLKPYKLATGGTASYPRNAASAGVAIDKLLDADLQAVFLDTMAELAAQSIK